MATKLVNALARQRVLAKVVDTLVPALVVLVAYLLDGGPAALLVAAVVVLAYWIGVLLWEATRGLTPGNLALGLATVSSSGGAPGVGAVVIRALVLGASNIVPVVGPLVLLVSNTWDRDGRRRGWHDKLVGTYVLDVRAGRNPLTTGGLHGSLSVPAAVRGQEPAYSPARGAEAGASAQAVRPLTEAVPAGTSGRRTTAGRPPQVMDGAEAALDAGAAGRASTASSFAPPEGGVPATNRPEPPAAATAPASSAGHQMPADTARPGTPATGTADGRSLVFDDGTEVEIGGQALIGRNPEPRPGESVDYLINFADLSRSVSKTHLHLRLEQGTVWVTDRGSTNGSFLIDPAGSEQQLHPEVPMLLPAGYAVRFGDRSFTVGAPDRATRIPSSIPGD